MSDTVFTPALLPVVHPLDDLPEQRLYRADLGRIRMTRTVRAALWALQAYLGCMVLLLSWRLLAGL
jgi:hypothetical protein